jgi:hypothetical protein
MKLSTLLATFAFASASAFGTTITCLTNNSGQCSNLAAQLSVTTSGSSLTISNLQLPDNTSILSAIDSIYFDPTPDNLITGIVIGISTGTVDFQQGANPANLPAGHNAVPPFTAVYGISSTSNLNRIDVGESLTVTASGGDLASLFSDGSVRIGLHIQSIGGPTGTSDALVITGNTGPVPEPGTLTLLGFSLALIAFSRIRIRRSNTSRPK